MNNKSQITLYIIIGIILLLTISLVTYFATTQITKSGVLGKQEREVKTYAEECIKQTAISALKKIGANGGFVDINDKKITKRNFRLDPRASEGDLLVLSEVGEYAIPYWWYLASNNKCKNCYATTDNIPTIEELKIQLDDYISKNTLSCMDFSDFEKQGIKVNLKDEKIEIDSYITEGNVRIIAEFPMEIIKKGSKTKIEKFETPVSVNLRAMYDLANKITKEEKENAFLERTIMHLISIYSGANFLKFPPIGEITHSNVIVSWPKSLLKEKTKQLLRSYIPLIQIAYTKDAKPIKTTGSPEEQGVYDALYLKFLEKDYPFSVRFSYLDWPIYFDATPRSGELIKPDVYKQNFFFDITSLQTNTYETYYDISTPLLMEIRDAEALGGEGYSFMVAMEANIRDNKNIPEWNKGEGTVGYWSTEYGQNIVHVDKIRPANCEETTDEKWMCPLDDEVYDELPQCGENCYTRVQEEKQLEITETMFCDEEQKLSGEISIKVIDAVTSEVIPGAAISFICGNYMTCTLGGTGDNGMFTTGMPICIGGILAVEQEGYFENRISVSTEQGKNENFVVELEPFREFDIKIKKIEVGINLTGERYTKKPSVLKTSDKAIVILERIKDTAFDTNHIQTMLFQGPHSPEQKIKLIPGKYKIHANFIDEQGFVIPAGCKKICVDYGTDWTDMIINENLQAVSFDMLEKNIDTPCEEYTYLPEEHIVSKPARLGGTLLDSENSYWEVSRSDIENKAGIAQFFALKFPTPTCIDLDGCILETCVGIDEMAKDREYSNQFRDEVTPIIN